MRDYQNIIVIFDLVSDYYQSISLELEKGGFGYNLHDSEERLSNHITSTQNDYQCDWAINPHLTQKVANLLEACYNFLISNQDYIVPKTNYYLQIFEFIVKCLDDIQFTTGIEPQQETATNLTKVEPRETPNNFDRNFPSELDTEQARKYFARAVEAGLMNEQYKWLKSQVLLACFCREMSIKLGLGKGVNSDNTKRLSWKPFEVLFGIKRGKLRSSLNDFKKTEQEPIGIEIVTSIFLD